MKPFLEPEALLALRNNPPRAGYLASQARERMFGKEILIREAPDELPMPGDSAVVRRGQVIPSSWPDPEAWQPGDRVMLALEPDDPPAWPLYIEWLQALAKFQLLNPAPEDHHLGPCAIAPLSHQAGGSHRLWAIAAARLVLPPSIRVEARHDLIGVRLAQVAIDFGADTISGPISAERLLPVAGVTRPSETSMLGLRSLIQQAKCEPATLELELDDDAPARVQRDTTTPMTAAGLQPRRRKKPEPPDNQ